MLRKLFLYLTLFCFIPVLAFTQEVITGLQSNYPLAGQLNKLHTFKGITAADTLALPVFDDFSGQTIYPDKKWWIDDFVFINNTYSDRQITLGVATFDALNNVGRLYETASSSGFKADQLTSKPMNLNYSASDNIWLSFLYQAGGLADSPEINDSLTLQFFAPAENKWYSVWRAEGKTSQNFKAVIIPVNQSRFLKRGFRLRFINYASLSQNLSDPSMVGNCDIWNIDYLKIDKNRHGADTVFADVAFRLPVRSVLKRHESMPWKQFKQISLQEMGASIPVEYRNNDVITRNITRNFEIRDVYKKSVVHSFTPGATNIGPLSDVSYNANLVYTFNTDNSDSALFRITCSLKTDAFDPKENDTVIYYQVFKNYFAFDDGSSEGGYGINGLGSRNAMLAYRFTSFIKDTVRAIQICFNDSYMDANKRAFDLMVWADNNGSPGNVIHSEEEVMVEQGDFINGFYSYRIPGGVPVNGIFYVGWKQRSESFLNAGFDVNTPHKGKQFYWINGEWNQSQVNGSVMIRPVVGDPLKITGIDDIYAKNKNLIKIWPNPASDHITVDKGDLPLSGLTYISIFDLSGRELIKVRDSERINITSLQKGIYIVITSHNGKPVGYNRLIKSK
jgi:hypothetical protein